VWVLRYASRQTRRQTDRQTDMLIAILQALTEGKVIWQKDALPPHRDGSMVFAR